jgi:hypothetical protein
LGALAGLRSVLTVAPDLTAIDDRRAHQVSQPGGWVNHDQVAVAVVVEAGKLTVPVPAACTGVLAASEKPRPAWRRSSTQRKTSVQPPGTGRRS